MRILFVGDICGRPGRTIAKQRIPALREAHHIDIVVANAENAAGGSGATPDTLRELRGAGVQSFTMGNHVWRKTEIYKAFDAFPELVRPANLPEGVPGRGHALIAVDGHPRLAIVNLLGRIYMEPADCPFRAGRALVEKLREETPVILVDFHAEATSEKVALGWHLDGLASAVLGTHTHVQTADEWILPGGTAYLSDVGMCGPSDGVIGVERATVVNRFLTGLPAKFDVPKTAPMAFSAVVLDIDDATGKANAIERVFEREPLH